MSEAASPDLTWMGPSAFGARYGDLPGIDYDCGTSWGANRDQRICVRQGTGDDSWLLYVYDPTWDEYAVLLDNITYADVAYSLANALTAEAARSAQGFAALVAEQQPAATPKVRNVGIGMQR